MEYSDPIIRNHSDIGECTKAVIHLCYQFVTNSNDPPPQNSQIFAPLPPGMTAIDIAQHIYYNYYYDLYPYIHAQKHMELSTSDEVEIELYEYILNVAHMYVFHTNAPGTVNSVLVRNCSPYLYRAIILALEDNFPNHHLYRYLTLPWKDFIPPNSTVNFDLLVPRDIIICCLQYHIRELELEKNDLLSKFKIIRSKKCVNVSNPSILNSSRYIRFQRTCDVTIDHLKRALKHVLEEYQFCQRMIPDIRNYKRFNIHETREESLLRFMREDNIDKATINKFRRFYNTVAG